MVGVQALFQIESSPNVFISLSRASAGSKYLHCLQRLEAFIALLLKPLVTAGVSVLHILFDLRSARNIRCSNAGHPQFINWAISPLLILGAARLCFWKPVQ
jgi:hypothetical protein